VIRTVLADTTPLYAAIDPSDEYYHQARTEMQLLAEDGWEVAVIMPTVMEAYSLIQRKLGNVAALKWLGEVNAFAGYLVPEGEDYSLALARIRRYLDQDITLFDTLLHAVSDRLSVPVWTYDHHFDTLGAQRWYPGA
jgi:predicted nucleic acid-binding protein